MIRNMFGGTKCRTIDKVDIFGDNSGVALYQLDGNANDTGGNYHGNETAVTYGGGVYERGAVFNGSSSFISNTFNTSFTAFSISVWTYQTSLQAVSYIYAGNLGLIRLDNSARFAVCTNRLGTTGDGLTYKTFNSTADIPLNTWTHWTLVSTGTTNISIYKNGTLFTNTGSLSDTLSASIAPNRLGCANSAGANSSFLNGSIDQVRIFNRAIIATEVATLYAECAPTSTVDNINPFMDGSLKALYQFNGDATDKTGVYNGTATNVTYGTGKFGQCAVLTASSIRNLAFGANPTSNYSISVWVKYSSLNAFSGICLLGTGLQISINGTSQYVIASINNANPEIYGKRANLSRFTSGQFNHIVASVNLAGNNINLYINGTLVNDGTGINTDAATGVSGVIAIGSRGDGTAAYWNGSIDQLRIFNKALTPLEVASLYNETTPLEEPMHKLVDPFKDGSGKALYRLEGNALDESGNYNGTATSVTYGAGQFGRAGVFTNGKIDTGTKTLMSSTVSYTVSEWVKRTNGVTNIIANRMNAASNYGDQFYWNSDNSIFIKFATGATSQVFTNTSAISVTAGTWHHVAFTANRTSGVAKVYVNGVEQTIGAITVPASSYDNNLNVLLGSTHSTTYSATLDQVRFFNVPLTLSQVQTLYTGENNVL